jgi:hypothetical protein
VYPTSTTPGPRQRRRRWRPLLLYGGRYSTRCSVSWKNSRPLAPTTCDRCSLPRASALTFNSCLASANFGLKRSNSSVRPRLHAGSRLPAINQGSVVQVGAAGRQLAGVGARGWPTFHHFTKYYSVHFHHSSDDKVIATILGLIANIEDPATKRNKSVKYRVTNDGCKGQKVREGYGGESLRRLQDVRRKYDPDGFYQNAMQGGFKLSNSEYTD